MWFLGQFLTVEPSDDSCEFNPLRNAPRTQLGAPLKGRSVGLGDRLVHNDRGMAGIGDPDQPTRRASRRPVLGGSAVLNAFGRFAVTRLPEDSVSQSTALKMPTTKARTDQAARGAATFAATILL